MLNSVKNKKERIGRMLEMNANDRTDVEQARAGDIVALVGCKDTTTGETLCDPENPVILEKMDFPEPVTSAHLPKLRPCLLRSSPQAGKTLFSTLLLLPLPCLATVPCT